MEENTLEPLLLNPKKHSRFYPDERSRELMLKTIQFFERKGKNKLKADDRECVWYADFLEFQKKEKIFATLLTPAGYGGPDCRWDTWRNSEFNEILAFYGLGYWYTWQVSILGLGPIWQSENEVLKQKATHLLDDGEVFAFGLSERQHGADIYSTEMSLTSQSDGSYQANGEKYYIGNGNLAPMVSTFGKFQPSGEYVFFIADYRQRGYDLIRNVTHSQSYVANFALKDYPVTESDILSKGQAAWDAALNTVNIGKFNLGWGSIGICTHAFYEAIHHAAYRRLYGMSVTDFPHVKMMFTEAYARLVAMKLFTLRAADYMRAASPEDRRYLLFNPVVKMKVTTQGEQVINLLWDVIAAKGFEKDMYFEMAARDIRALPKLEGTVHVNIALIVKFMANYFFFPREYPPLSRQDAAQNDNFLFHQGPAKGLSKIQFHDYSPVFKRYELPNIRVFAEQVSSFKAMLAQAPPGQEQIKDTDFLLTLGEAFTQVVYAQLVLENAVIYSLEDSLVDQMFDFMVRDLSYYALKLYSQPNTTPEQMGCCLKMIKRPEVDLARFNQVWAKQVLLLRDEYEMTP
jgi:acyl-CoA dehydrogenase